MDIIKVDRHLNAPPRTDFCGVFALVLFSTVCTSCVNIYDSGPDDDERDVLKRIGISPKHKEIYFKRDKIEIIKLVDDEVLKQGGQKVGAKNGFALYVFGTKIFVVCEFDKRGVWFAKRSVYPHWSSHNEQTSSPIYGLAKFVSSLRKQLPHADVIGIVAVPSACDIVEMDQECVDEWSRQGLFCTVISEASIFNKLPTLRDFLLAGDGAKYDQDKVLVSELREAVVGIRVC